MRITVLAVAGVAALFAVASCDRPEAPAEAPAPPLRRSATA